MSRFVPVLTLLACACSPAPDDDVASSFAVGDSATITAVPPAECRDLRVISALPAALFEASGIAASRQHADVLWAHNDSDGEPRLYQLGLDGTLHAHIEVSGLDAQIDWEDIAIGPCPDGHCLFIGAIGDNLHDDTARAVLRIAEPAPGTDTAGHVETFPYRFPDGPSDAEALFVLPDSSIWIITKGRNRPSAVYRYPMPLRPDERVTLEKVQEIGPPNAQLPDLVTGAAATPDGRIVVVRTYSAALFHPVEDGRLGAPLARLDLKPLEEPQGEGITITAEGTLFMVSEQGPGSGRAAALLSRADCVLP